MSGDLTGLCLYIYYSIFRNPKSDFLSRAIFFNVKSSTFHTVNKKYVYQEKKHHLLVLLFLGRNIQKYLVILLGAGSTQNVFYTQQCNFRERAQGKRRKLQPHPYNVILPSPVELFLGTTLTSQIESSLFLIVSGIRE